MHLHLSDVISYEPRSGHLWDVEFENLNILNNKKFPAQSVNWDEVEPIIETKEFGPGIPLTLVKGYKQPETLTINFLDNQALEVRTAINNYIKKSKSGSQKLFNRVGIRPADLAKHAIKVTVTEYNNKYSPINTRIFLTVPEKALSISLNDNNALQESLPLTLRIVGIIDNDL